MVSINLNPSSVKEFQIILFIAHEIFRKQKACWMQFLWKRGENKQTAKKGKIVVKFDENKQ